MKKVRMSIEWSYGHTVSLFKYVGIKHKLKVLADVKVQKVYTVATILRNIHAALYGCQASSYFDISLPTNFTEHYLNQTDF